MAISSNSTFLQSVGNKIRKIRKDKELSQEELALKAGIDRSYMGRIERGEKNITVLTLLQIAKTLGTTISELINSK